jgi:hypothetical protein
VSYTVWSKGRLVGETDLGFAQLPGGARAGHFFPSAVGQTLMPIATGVPPASAEVARMCRRVGPPGPDTLPSGPSSNEDSDRGTARADLAAAEDRSASLELELRGPDGLVIATEWIAIQDTEQLLSFAELDEEMLEREQLFGRKDEQLLADIEADDATISGWFGRGDPDKTGAEDDCGFDESDLEDELWEPEIPRYQIFLQLSIKTAT